MEYRNTLTYDQVSSILRHDEETGKFYWLTSPARNVRAGSEAGAVKVTRKAKEGVSTSYRYIRYSGWNIPATQIAWILSYGEWPIGRITFKDNNTLNLRMDNLEMQNGVDGKFDYKDQGERKAYMKAHRDQNPLVWKNSYLQQSYGISLADYGNMLVAQGGKCAICDRPETHMRSGTVKALAVDHDHRTGKIRALLCSDCNTGLGKFQDDPKVLLAAAEYLSKHSPTAVLGA